jgi:aminoglycoside/choline kinase family phosphotransferase
LTRNFRITMETELNTNITDSLLKLFKTCFGREALSLEALPGAGSDRKYFRISDHKISAIGSYNPDRSEHSVFLNLCSHFKNAGLPVPEIYATGPENGTCLLQDLGDETLLSWIDSHRKSNTFIPNLTSKYRQVLSDLIRFQLDGDKGLDYQQLPVASFNSHSMHWDLNYFKYYFLKPSGINYNEKALQEDFDALVAWLQQESLQGFMYRDFQARNIMIHDGSMYYIDFQGGRKGPLQYDVASLLFQVKAGLPDAIKEELINFYTLQLRKRVDFDISVFKERLKGFVLHRILQVMGAYGYRGWFERKPHFLESISLLKPNLEWVLKNQNLPVELHEITRVLTKILLKMDNDTLLPKTSLKVTINSFSFRRGIPYDPSGHGGGFVFDCRLLPNPGRLVQYRQQTGMDEDVAGYLSNEPAVNSFVDSVNQMVSQAIDSYQKAGYEHLQVNFGCTGGRHRSVYCAEKLTEALRSQKDIIVTVTHQELKNLISNE